MSVISRAKSANVELVEWIDGLEEAECARTEAGVIPRRTWTIQLEMINILKIYLIKLIGSDTSSSENTFKLFGTLSLVV